MIFLCIAISSKLQLQPEDRENDRSKTKTIKNFLIPESTSSHVDVKVLVGLVESVYVEEAVLCFVDEVTNTGLPFGKVDTALSAFEIRLMFVLLP